MKNTDFYYAVTRVHYQERFLLNADDLHKLSSFETTQECLKFLASKGWSNPTANGIDVEEILHLENQRTWEFLGELIPDVEALSLFRISFDFDNIKAAVKLVYSQIPPENYDRYFMPYGKILPLDLVACAKMGDFSALPEHMKTVAEKAYQALSQTGSGQICDTVVDVANIEYLSRFAEESKLEFYSQYAKTVADSSNIKICLRAIKMDKNEEFYRLAVADCGSFDKNKLIKASLRGMEKLISYLKTTSYKNYLHTLDDSIAAFERLCDDKFMDFIRPYKYVNHGIEPLLAYLIARGREIKAVKLILSAKINKLDSDKIAQRMRKLYV